MSKSINVSNISISELNDVKNPSSDNPLVHSSSIINGIVDVTVRAPFHSNVSSTTNPVITASISNGINNIVISPSFDSNSNPTTSYTQILQISFKINNVYSIKGSASISVVIDEDGQSASNANSNRLRAPKRKTVIIATGA